MFGISTRGSRLLKKSELFWMVCVNWASYNAYISWRWPIFGNMDSPLTNAADFLLALHSSFVSVCLWPTRDHFGNVMYSLEVICFLSWLKSLICNLLLSCLKVKTTLTKDIPFLKLWPGCSDLNLLVVGPIQYFSLLTYYKISFKMNFTLWQLYIKNDQCQSRCINYP